MISSIVDSTGILVYTGNDANPKFSTVLARAGHGRVDVDVGNFDKPKWNGSAWVEGITALELWKQEMAESDTLIPRWAEDLYDGLELEIRDGINAVTKNKIIQKKSKRELRPV